MRRKGMTLPNLTVYTDRLPRGVGGDAHGPVVRIRHQYRNDVGLHWHEWLHVRQWWIASAVSLMALVFIAPMEAWLLAVAVHPALYKFVRRYRLWAEVRAYRIQMQYPNASGVPLTLESAALRLMSPRYDLRLTMGMAKELLLAGWA